jgi:glycosyltransferase involved in cell wall biosynthesis
MGAESGVNSRRTRAASLASPVRILFIAPYLPSMVRIRPYQWIRSLTQLGHHVHVVALRPPEDRWASLNALRQICGDADIFELGRLRTVANAAGAVVTGAPLQCAYSDHPAASERIAQLAAAGGFDVVHIEHMRGVVLARRIRNLPVVYDAVDSITALFEKAAAQAPSRAQRLVARLDLARTRRFEARLPFQFARTLVTSSAEAEAFVRLAGEHARARLVVLPNGVDLDYFTPAPTPSNRAPTILLSGKMSYHANEAAAIWLVKEIMPRVWADEPSATVVIAGKDPGAAIQSLASERVRVTGFLEDLRHEFWSATVAVAPLRYGAGIQNKVLEAMACALPVVTTTPVARALEPASRDCLRVADTSESFAATISALLRSRDEAQAIGQRGRVYVERNHQWARQTLRLLQTYHEAGTAAEYAAS